MQLQSNKLKYKKEPYGDHEYTIELIDHEFSGIKFTLGKVGFVEENDNFTLKFHYDIIENDHSEYDKQSFEKTVGDLVMQMIDDGLDNENLIYYGGKDEN